jgi:protein phosphatase/serine/threonine-protein phosphatase Stp1
LLQQITRDHSLVQELVDAGALDAADAEGHPHSNVITRAVGDLAETMELDKVTGRIEVGDRFLLCSDGLSKVLDDSAIADLMEGTAVVETADRLVAEALARHTSDNVTAVVVEVVGSESTQWSDQPAGC